MSKQELFYQRLNIAEFVMHRRVLNDSSFSPGQMMCLKTIYGLPLDETELALYIKATGRAEYVPKELKEFTALCGRRGGKTSRIGAPIVCYETFRDHGLPGGERAYVLLIAPVLEQAQIAFRNVRSYIMSSGVLSKKVQNITRDEIELDNGIVIACWPCSSVTVRGLSVIAAVLDEVAYWPDDENSPNSLESVLSALRPAMITFPRSKTIKLTTPGAKHGFVWEEYQRRGELDYPVVQLSSTEMNPQLDAAVLETERQRSESNYRSQILAEFVENIVTWVDPEVLNRCVVPDRRDLPHLVGPRYVAVVDPAFRHSDFALAILHKKEELVVVDRVALWVGTKRVPVAFDRVCEEVRNYLEEFHIYKLYGDQYCVEPLRQQFMKSGIVYEEFSFNDRTRRQIFGNLLHLLGQGKIELLDHPELLRQLRGLEERAGSDGSIDIRPRYSLKDDLAVCVALGAFQLSSETQLSSIIMSGSSLGYNPDPRSCHLQAVCENFPDCLIEGSCLDFVETKHFGAHTR